MQKRFVSKIRKLPEVQAILVRGGQFTVIVEKAEARVYIRVNSLVEAINAKLFHGQPFEAAVRDDEGGDDEGADMPHRIFPLRDYVDDAARKVGLMGR